MCAVFLLFLFKINKHSKPDLQECCPALFKAAHKIFVVEVCSKHVILLFLQNKPKNVIHGGEIQYSKEIPRTIIHTWVYSM
jgi:hypothetical protein